MPSVLGTVAGCAASCQGDTRAPPPARGQDARGPRGRPNRAPRAQPAPPARGADCTRSVSTSSQLKLTMPRYQEKTPRWGKPLLLWLLVVLGLVVPCLPRGDIDVLSLNEVNPQCWELSTIAVIKMQKPRMTHTVGEFWNFMLDLKNSDNPYHAKNFWDLAQLFWDKYVQCVISISHGLGRRETATAAYSAAHSPRRAPDFASVPHRQAGLLMKMSFPTYLERIIKKFQQF
ncbi:uncharacterized protein LOC133344468 [Lethenteron reissneri]|uniref:uncharacterized protein LOC133344468 n=1 Tax=Lethenteron reissneri TaxID=7753 RepID=UPI002AB739D0|nr:uncharacterized protein LOC133344468 [Lethenteron reissneri]